MKTRVVCLPTTKRLMRFESQCIEAPVEINLPRPRIRLDNEPVRYLKSIPRFREHFVQEAAINLQEPHYDGNSSVAQSPPADSGQDSDDLISSLENISNNDASSLYATYNLSAASAGVGASALESSSADITPDEQSYARLPANETVKADKLEQQQEASSSSAPSSCTCDQNEPRQYLRNYIHYCLYVFHGLYNPDKVREFAKQQLEFRIRTHMLNFKFVEAFQLCLQDCGNASKTLKTFEYFTKDTGYVPMRRQDLKFLIYHMLQHFLTRKLELLECERFFLADLDYYLLELAYVLYFNNNNTLLEQNLNKKFKSLLAQESGNGTAADQNLNEHKLQDTDVIFDSLSVKFKTILCQRLMEHCGN